MKTISKVLITIILMSALESNAAICKSFSGFTVITQALKVGKTRVPGNTMVYIYDQENKPLATFSAESDLAGNKPEGNTVDTYKIESIFEDKVGMKGFQWSSYNEMCPISQRCPSPKHTNIEITIQGQSEPVQLVCE